jgi:hypothetical protein
MNDRGETVSCAFAGAKVIILRNMSAGVFSLDLIDEQHARCACGAGGGFLLLVANNVCLIISRERVIYVHSTVGNLYYMKRLERARRRSGTFFFREGLAYYPLQDGVSSQTISYSLNITKNREVSNSIGPGKDYEFSRTVKYSIDSAEQPVNLHISR